MFSTVQGREMWQRTKSGQIEDKQDKQEVPSEYCQRRGKDSDGGDGRTHSTGNRRHEGNKRHVQIVSGIV